MFAQIIVFIPDEYFLDETKRDSLIQAISLQYLFKFDINLQYFGAAADSHWRAPKTIAG